MWLQNRTACPLCIVAAEPSPRARCAGLKQLESADNRAETVKALQWYEQQLRNRCALAPCFHWAAVLRGYIQGYQTSFSHSSTELAPAACHQQGGVGALDAPGTIAANLLLYLWWTHRHVHKNHLLHRGANAAQRA